MRDWKEGDKLLCVSSKYPIREGKVYTFRAISNGELYERDVTVLIKEFPMSFFASRFVKIIGIVEELC